jgi:Holliday junction resolvase
MRMSPGKQKGTSFETLIVRYLRTVGFPYAERRALHGNLDKGDVTGCGPLVFECKAAKRHELSAWLQETEVERVNANADFGVLVVKRQGHGTGEEQYAVMRFADAVRLLKQAGY